MKKNPGLKEPRHDKTNKISVRPANSDQPGHPPSLIKVFAVRSMGSWRFKVSSCGQWRLIRLGRFPGWSEPGPFCWFCHVAAQITEILRQRARSLISPGVFTCIFELTHEIMALFALHKLILQTGMRSHPVGLDVWFLVGPFIYLGTSCVWTAKALVRLHR